MGKKLYGYVAKENIEYEWKTEPGACEVCQGLDGTIYDSANDIPDRPHSNCKCWIDILEKEADEPVSDPIEAHREVIKDRKINELELAKLMGDAKSLEQEIDEYIRRINEQDKELERFENSIDNSKLDLKDKQRLSDLKENIDFAKYKGDKAKQDVEELKMEIEKTEGRREEISRIQRELDKLRQKRDDLAVKYATTWNALLYGRWHAFRYDMPEAYNFFKIAVDKKITTVNMLIKMASFIIA